MTVKTVTCYQQHKQSCQWAQLKLCDSLLQFISSLSAVVLRNGELGLERASLSDDCLHAQQLVNEILHTGQEQLSAQSWQHETPRLSHLYTYVVFPTWNVIGWVSGCKRRVWSHSGYMAYLNVLWESQEYFYTTRLSNQAKLTWWGLAVQLYSVIQRKGAVWILSASEKNIFICEEVMIVLRL